jgi:S1-C subfamily serine protease
MIHTDIAGVIGNLTSETAALVEWIRRSVVLVHSQSGQGSGTVWRADGLIVTNHHVVPTGSAIVEMSDGRRWRGEVIGRDSLNDLAAIRVAASGLQAVSPGDSRKVQLGQLVIAVGHPLGVRDNASLGIVSATQRALQRGRRACDILHVDVDLAPGNSGGPVVDMNGRVLGIASMVVSPGIAVAVPSHVVAEFLASSRSRAAMRPAAA